MNKALLILVCALTLVSGCMLPKPVELFQDKVKSFPVAKAREKEVQRQVAQRAAEKTEETLMAAIEEDASPSVIVPATEANVLTEAVATSLGPPEKPASEAVTSDELAQKLDTAVAKLSSRIDDFKSDNNENAGKKIEGTGLFQIPYLVYLGLMVALIVGAFVVFKIVGAFVKVYSLSNPPVALGLKAVQTGGALASKSVSQLVAGGEKFKEWLKTEITDLDEATTQKIEQLFVDAHKEAQDQDVKDVVKALIKK